MTEANSELASVRENNSHENNSLTQGLKMNAATKKKLSAIYGELCEIRVRLETIRDAEQEAYDAKSEKWQESDKGEAASAINEQLQEAYDAVETAEGICGELADME